MHQDAEVGPIGGCTLRGLHVQFCGHFGMTAVVMNQQQPMQTRSPIPQIHQWSCTWKISTEPIGLGLAGCTSDDKSLNNAPVLLCGKNTNRLKTSRLKMSQGKRSKYEYCFAWRTKFFGSMKTNETGCLHCFPMPPEGHGNLCTCVHQFDSIHVKYPNMAKVLIHLQISTAILLVVPASKISLVPKAFSKKLQHPPRTVPSLSSPTLMRQHVSTAA